MNAISIELAKGIAATLIDLDQDRSVKGIVLTGGGALLKGLDHRIKEDTGLPVFLAEDPLSSVAIGTGMMLEEMELLKRISVQ